MGPEREALLRELQSFLWENGGAMLRAPLRTALPNRRQNIHHHFALGLRTHVTFTVQTDGNRAGFHVATADHQHRVDFGLLGVGDLGFHGIAAEIARGADLVGTQFIHDLLRVIEQRLILANCDAMHLLGREPGFPFASAGWERRLGKLGMLLAQGTVTAASYGVAKLWP